MSMYHKCSRNYHKITASYLGYHKVTVKFAWLLHMQIVRYKTNKLTIALKAKM